MDKRFVGLLIRSCYEHAEALNDLNQDIATLSATYDVDLSDLQGNHSSVENCLACGADIGATFGNTARCDNGHEWCQSKTYLSRVSS